VENRRLMAHRRVESELDEVYSKPLLLKKAIELLTAAKSLDDLKHDLNFDFVFERDLDGGKLPEWEIKFIRALIRAGKHIGIEKEVTDASNFLKGKVDEFGIELFLDSGLDPTNFKSAKRSLLTVLKHAILAVKKAKLRKSDTDKFVKYE